jgi:FkbM family methyltransferase
LEQFVFAIQPDDVVFDVGASVGLMTVYDASAAFKGRVFAFELDPLFHHLAIIE